MKTQEEIEQLAEQYWDKQPYNEDAYVIGYTQCQEDMTNNVKVTRFEVIDESGRVCTRHNCKVELSYQDDGKTLKVFLNEQS
jgi:SHS2 domain-containing protein